LDGDAISAREDVVAAGDPGEVLVAERDEW
jgi:hypothetical protein